MIVLFRSLVICALFGAAAVGRAQAPAGANLIVNGDFAKFTPEDNLWDGIDAAGFVGGWIGTTYAVTESGRVGGLPMPISVAFADVNGDSLPDLITADPTGFLRAYINSGTKTEPKFTHAEIIPLFPPRMAKDYLEDRVSGVIQGTPKIALYDFNRRGTLDLIIGNYGGDIVLVPNTGSTQSPAYAQPASYGKVRIPTSNKRPWGNLFAPCPIDWNRDGKTDLLIGDGSYSANSVFILLNQSGSNEPKFAEEQRYYLCYGDGREQLIPTVADYNGDGQPDVLVGDRLGTVGVFINPGTWKPGNELPLATNIQFGDKEKLGTPIAPFAADFNGDGLFDLLIGKGNGHVAVALNTGTKSEPKFGTPVDLKGVDLMKDKINAPTGWTLDNGKNRGNLYTYVSVMPKDASPNGGKVLKAGYFPSPNKAYKLVPIAIEGKETSVIYFHEWRDAWEPVPATWTAGIRSTDNFSFRQNLPPLKPGATYHLSFKVKGAGIEGGSCTIAYLGVVENAPRKVKRGDRGGVTIDKNETHEEVLVTESFSSGNAWKTVEKTFQVAFKDGKLKQLEATTLALIEFKFTLPQYSADCEICDVQLTAKGK